uniref:Amino acid transporter transmembrane domain-containing protein n=1 Tax=Euplotes harpa TaxID=151035 RepID=A0A7S3J4R7_9SPIT|mmetsp:Transcript_20000/g.23190  ORF Transcript_20000/g.23190 Transcript_20000/m.23190 type:complete len:140 (+) Transcript_20000:324-743(+)
MAVNISVLGKLNKKEYEEKLKAQEKVQSTPTHRDMPLWIYLTVTFGVFGVDVGLACFLDDVSIVFGFIGALSISMLFFIIPGSFYVKSVHLAAEKGDLKRLVISWVYIIFGFMVMFGGLASVLVKIIEDDQHDSPVDPE